MKIAVSKRTDFGKKLKRNPDYIIGVLSNPNKDSMPFVAKVADVRQILSEAKSSSVIEVQYEKDNYLALLGEVQKDPVSGAVIHFSMNIVDPKKEIDIDVPVRFTGTPLAVKNSLGVFSEVLDSIRFRARIEDIIDEIIVDVSKMSKVGDVVRLDSSMYPSTLKFVWAEQKNAVLASIVGFTGDAVEAEASSEAATPEEPAK